MPELFEEEASDLAVQRMKEEIRGIPVKRLVSGHERYKVEDFLPTPHELLDEEQRRAAVLNELEDMSRKLAEHV